MPRKIKNILVTGGAGFIGANFIYYLLSKNILAPNPDSKNPDSKNPDSMNLDSSNQDIKVINFDKLTYAAKLDNLNEAEKDPRYVFVQGDILNKKLVEETLDKYDVDTIVHFAAESHVDNSISGPKVFLDSNIYGTFALLETLRNRKHIHFHHVSTDEVYGSLGDEGYFSEKTPYCPSSPYSASKAASDHLVMSFHKTYGLSITMSHCSNNFGPFQHSEKLIPLMLKHCLLEKPLPIYGNGKNIRDWLYVTDHNEAILTILQKGENGQVYDIGGGEEKTNIDIVKTIISTLSNILDEGEGKYLSLIEFVKDRLGHDYRYAIDISKIKNELGWSPKYSFDKGLEDTIKWYLKNDYEEIFSQKSNLCLV